MQQSRVVHSRDVAINKHLKKRPAKRPLDSADDVDADDVKKQRLPHIDSDGQLFDDGSSDDDEASELEKIMQQIKEERAPSVKLEEPLDGSEPRRAAVRPGGASVAVSWYEGMIFQDQVDTLPRSEMRHLGSAGQPQEFFNDATHNERTRRLFQQLIR